MELASVLPAPSFRKLSMISAKGRGRAYVEEQAHGSTDDRSVEATGGRAEGGGCGAGSGGVEAYDLRLEGMDVSQAQEAKQLRDENTRLRKLVADLSLDKEALQFGDPKKRVELVALDGGEPGAVAVRENRGSHCGYVNVQFIVALPLDGFLFGEIRSICPPL